MEVGEADALVVQPIEPIGHDHRIPVAMKIAVALVVRKYEYHIGPLAYQRSGVSGGVRVDAHGERGGACAGELQEVAAGKSGHGMPPIHVAGALVERLPHASPPGCRSPAALHGLRGGPVRVTIGRR